MAGKNKGAGGHLLVRSMPNASERARNRASPKALVNLKPHLSAEQKTAIGDMNLRSMLDIKCNLLHNPLINWLGPLYDKHTRQFVIPGRGRIPLDADSVYRTLGLPRGQLPVRYAVDSDIEARLAPIIFPDHSSTPKITQVGTILKEMTDFEDRFKQTYIMYLVCTLLCPTSCNKVSNRVYHMMDNFAQVPNMNICKFVADKLHEELSGDSWGAACLFHMQLLYVESLDVRHLNIELSDGPFVVNRWSKKNIDTVLNADLKRDCSGYGLLELKPHLAINLSYFGGAAAFEQWIATNTAANCPKPRQDKVARLIADFSSGFTGLLGKLVQGWTELDEDEDIQMDHSFADAARGAGIDVTVDDVGPSNRMPPDFEVPSGSGIHNSSVLGVVKDIPDVPDPKPMSASYVPSETRGPSKNIVVQTPPVAKSLSTRESKSVGARLSATNQPMINSSNISPSHVSTSRVTRSATKAMKRRMLPDGGEKAQIENSAASKKFAAQVSVVPIPHSGCPSKTFDASVSNVSQSGTKIINDGKVPEKVTGMPTNKAVNKPSNISSSPVSARRVTRSESKVMKPGNSTNVGELSSGNAAANPSLDCSLEYGVDLDNSVDNNDDDDDVRRYIIKPRPCAVQREDFEDVPSNNGDDAGVAVPAGATDLPKHDIPDSTMIDNVAETSSFHPVGTSCVSNTEKGIEMVSNLNSFNGQCEARVNVRNVAPQSQSSHFVAPANTHGHHVKQVRKRCLQLPSKEDETRKLVGDAKSGAAEQFTEVSPPKKQRKVDVKSGTVVDGNEKTSRSSPRLQCKDAPIAATSNYGKKGRSAGLIRKSDKNAPKNNHVARNAGDVIGKGMSSSVCPVSEEDISKDTCIAGVLNSMSNADHATSGSTFVVIPDVRDPTTESVSIMASRTSNVNGSKDIDAAQQTVDDSTNVSTARFSARGVTNDVAPNIPAMQTIGNSMSASASVPCAGNTKDSEGSSLDPLSDNPIACSDLPFVPQPIAWAFPTENAPMRCQESNGVEIEETLAVNARTRNDGIGDDAHIVYSTPAMPPPVEIICVGSNTPRTKLRMARVVVPSKYMLPPYSCIVCDEDQDKLYQQVIKHHSDCNESKIKDTRFLEIEPTWVYTWDLANSVMPSGQLSNTVAEIGIAVLQQNCPSKKIIFPWIVTVYLLERKFNSNILRKYFRRDEKYQLSHQSLLSFAVFQELGTKEKPCGHWYTLFLNFDMKRFEVLDSARADDDQSLITHASSLVDAIKEMYLINYSESSKQIQNYELEYIDAPKQNNKLDCGFFMLKFLELWNGRVVPAITFDQIPALRKVLTWEWLNHPLNKFERWKKLLEQNWQ